MTDIEAAIGKDEVPALIQEAVRLISPVAPREVGNSQRLIYDLGYHSLALAELGFTLEDLFGLDAVTPEQAMMMNEVGDIITLVESAIADDRARLPVVADVQALCGRYGTVWQPRP
jgi:acyl carrier protein